MAPHHRRARRAAVRARKHERAADPGRERPFSASPQASAIIPCASAKRDEDDEAGDRSDGVATAATT